MTRAVLKSGVVGPALALLAGLAAMFALPVAAASGSAPPTTPSQPAARQIFLRDCAVCHGADAAGTSKAPTLQGVGRANVSYQLSTGRMPLPASANTWSPSNPVADARRRSPAYDKSTIAALVDYVASIAPGGPDIPTVDLSQADVSRGGNLFRGQCAACHEWAGEGGALQYGRAPGLTEATPQEIAEAVRVGPGTMPVFGEAALSQQDLNDLVVYVQGLDNPVDAGGQPLWHLGPLAEGAAAFAALAILVVALRMIGTRT